MSETMVAGVEGRQLSLPQSSLSSPPQITSFLLDPASLSLALHHSDSSFSLYPSFSPFSLSSLPNPQTLIPSPTSSATFLHIQSSASRLLFAASAPHLAGAAVLLRFWILKTNPSLFARAKATCNQRDLKFDEKREAVVLGVEHGVSVKLSGSVNVLAMYSASNRKVWVFAVKLTEEEVIKVMRTAVIECCLPVFSVGVSFGVLILGEADGVRVFQLRPLVKGTVKKQDKLVKLSNGKIQAISSNGRRAEKNVEFSNNAPLERKSNKSSDSAKPRSVKVIQDSKEGGGCFVSFKREVKKFNSNEVPLRSAKAIYIQALSPNKFLIMGSVGDVHLLCVPNPVIGSEISCYMKHLPLTMKVQKLAALPDVSAREHTFWISDGQYTVHAVTTSDMDASISESDNKDDDEKLMQISVTSAIFASEKIQEIIPLAANEMLILGQASMSAYAFS